MVHKKLRPPFVRRPGKLKRLPKAPYEKKLKGPLGKYGPVERLPTLQKLRKPRLPKPPKNRKRKRFPSSGAPHELPSRYNEFNEYKHVTGYNPIFPPNGDYLLLSQSNEFSVLGQYVGPKPKPLKGSYHDFSWRKVDIVYPHGFAHLDRSDGFTKYQDGILSGSGRVSTPDTDQNAAYNTALSRLYDKYRGSVDLSIDTYQWKQSVRLAEKIFAVSRYVRTFNIPKLFESFVLFNFKRGRSVPGGIQYVNTFRKDWRHYAKEGGGLWLEYSYGLKPLISDCYDTMAEFQRSFEPLLTVEGRAAVKNNRMSSSTQTNFGWTNVDYKESVQDEVRVKIICTFAFSASNVTTLSRFSTLNPLGFIWENTPFSFCVDWFVGVGSYLRNFESALLSRKDFRSGFVTTSRLFDCTTVFDRGHTDDLGGGITASYTFGATAHYRRVDMSRSLLSSSPTPRTPTVKFDFSSLSKALNAISLLGTFFSKR